MTSMEISILMQLLTLALLPFLLLCGYWIGSIICPAEKTLDQRWDEAAKEVAKEPSLGPLVDHMKIYSLAYNDGFIYYQDGNKLIAEDTRDGFKVTLFNSEINENDPRGISGIVSVDNPASEV